jgi:hypothetical protein
MSPIEGVIASARLLSEVSGTLGLPIDRWEIPEDTSRTHEWVERAFEDPAQDVGDWTARAFLAGEARCSIYVREKVHIWEWDWPVDSPETLDHALQYCEQVAIVLAERGLLQAARWHRVEGVPWCLPEVPLGDSDVQGRFCTQEEIAAEHDDVDGFLSAWSVTRVGDGFLLSRGRGAYDRVAYLAAIRDSQWTMARIARPGTVEHTGRRPTEEERPVWGAGEPRLHIVGYLPDLSALEYAAHVGPDEHIHGWEVDQLRWLLEGGQLADGRPVKEVRVSFPDREMAGREKRPLLDIGVRVLYMEGGEEHEITE